MADLHENTPSRACKCLNVRIWPQPCTEKPPEFLMPTAGDSEYTTIYVGQRGVSISHPQVTMRTRKIGPPIADSSRCIRLTTLICLLCQTNAYRVQQLVASDVDRQEGPLFPCPDWVERETLLSSCGWIDVHKDCLVAEDVTRLSTSSTYSSTFGIALPQRATLTAPPTQPVHETPQESREQTNVTPVSFFSNLKPLFPPAPFVPSHPVFAHLSSIAVQASEHLRSMAEEQIATIVRDKYAELENADNGLRQYVEDLWLRFVENMAEAERRMGAKGGEVRREGSRGHSVTTTGVSGTPLVSIRHFVPTPSMAPRVKSPSSSLPRVSSLSASLATSRFHHPCIAQESADVRGRSSSESPRSPPPYSSHPSSLDSAESSISSSLESSPKVSPRMNGDSIAQPFKRSMDETRDTAVSFRYFTILEADVARARQQQTTSQQATRSEGDAKPTREKGDSDAMKPTPPVKETEEAHAHPPENSDQGAVAHSDGVMQRRKVKFDIKAESVAGDESVNGNSRENEELIFDLDEGGSDPEYSDAAPTLPFVENAQARHLGRHRVASLGALPALSSLRPTSLPSYSLLQSNGAEEPIMNAANRGTSYTTSPALLSQETRPEYPEPLNPQEEEILRLVAADTPSHRSAWKRDSKAWQLFVNRRRNGAPGALIPEETEDGSGRGADGTNDDDWGSSRDIRWSLGNVGFPTSLPIDISPLSRQKEPLSLASYQPKTSLSNRPGVTAPDVRRHTSTAHLRRASYAERDRSRAMDPGTLDFIAGDGEDAVEDESDEEAHKGNISDEGRGRQRAFKILEARSRIPEAGMWMSLA